MDYASYILPAYALAAVLLGGLMFHTWIAARRTSKALRTRDEA